MANDILAEARISLNSLNELADDLDEAVEGALYYQYTKDGITYDVIKIGNTYYYINGDEQAEVAESDLDKDDSGNLVTLRKNGLNDAIDDANDRADSLDDALDRANESIKSIEDIVDKNKEDAASTASTLEKSIQDTYNKVAELNDYLVKITGMVTISDSILVGSESGYNIQITDTAINLREKQTNLAFMDGDALNITTADVTYLRLGKYILEAMEDGSLVLKAR